MKMLILAFLFCSKFGYSQSSDTTRLYTFVEQMPASPGGEAELIKLIHKSIIWNCSDTSEIKSKITVSFVIDVDGSVIQPQIIKGICPEVDNQFLSIVTKMHFIPGKQQGKAVRVKYLLPVIICLTDH